MDTKDQIELQRAIAEFSSHWTDFRRSANSRTADRFQAVLDIVRRYEQLSSLLYRMRGQFPYDDPMRIRVENFMSEVGSEVINLQTDTDKDKSGYVLWVKRYREIWKENTSLLLYTAIVFISSLIVGWYVVLRDPRDAAAFIDQKMMETIIGNQRWFDNLHHNPFLGGVRIALNNIQVSISVFVFGAMLGVGGLALLIYNGLNLGAVMAFCYLNSFDDQLRDFVIGHGVLELSVIVASAFASFLIGRVFYMRPYKLFGKRMGLAAADAGCILTGICPWLILAAIIESFVSPHKEIPFEIRIVVGSITGMAFWYWNFRPNFRPKVPPRPFTEPESRPSG